MIELTDRQDEVLKWIKVFISKNGYSPTRQEIADAFDIHTNGAQHHINALAKKEAITVTPKISRSIVVIEETPEIFPGTMEALNKLSILK